MKKTIILATALAGLSLSSCKKAYKCECTTQDQGMGYSLVSTRDISKTSKKNAEAICGNSTDVYTDNYSSGSGTSSNIILTQVTTCALK